MKLHKGGCGGIQAKTSWQPITGASRLNINDLEGNFEKEINFLCGSGIFSFPRNKGR
jgi:hypothetical protein